jgi:uncharacterized membrane protein YeaQ/YmgE (transglycosylase-associated protein family)
MLGTILWGIIGGAILGALGRFFVPGRQNFPIWLTILVGIAAALLGGVIATWLGVGETRGIDWIKHIIQLLLAVLFVWLTARIIGSRSSPTGSGPGHTVA